MDRKDFFKKFAIGALAIVVTPKIITDIKPKEKGLVFDGVDSYLDLSVFDYYYDFTNPEYGIFDSKGNVIGWKDISGHGRNAISFHIPYGDIKVKKFAIKHGVDCVENYVKYF